MGHFGAEVGFDDLSLRDISAVVRRVESHVLFGGVHIGDRCACRIIRIGDYGQIRAVDLYNILFAPVDVGFADERRAGAGRRESKGYLAVLFVRDRPFFPGFRPETWYRPEEPGRGCKSL